MVVCFGQFHIHSTQIGGIAQEVPDVALPKLMDGFIHVIPTMDDNHKLCVCVCVCVCVRVCVHTYITH